MFDEQVGGADLALVVGISVSILVAVLARGGGRRRGAVVLGHVGFELFGVGAGGGLPAGFFGRGVEVVGEVFGVGVADFPGGGEAGVGLGGEGSARWERVGRGGCREGGGAGWWGGRWMLGLTIVKQANECGSCNGCWYKEGRKCGRGMGNASLEELCCPPSGVGAVGHFLHTPEMRAEAKCE